MHALFAYKQCLKTAFFARSVTIGVLWHVVVSQTSIVHMPYATVTGKYFRALIYAHVQTPIHAYAYEHVDAKNLCTRV